MYSNRKYFNINIILVTLISWSISSKLFACSSVVLKKDGIFLLGKNFDWTFDGGYLIKNIRKTHKVAYYTHSAQPMEWTSKYGSVTFNQNGKEMPYGGINEKGLVVEMLWLDETKYNLFEKTPYLNELEWIQYQLDNYASIEEVKSNLGKCKIYPIKGKIHYILADKSGHSIIIEYVAGKALIYAKDPNACQAITNKTVKHSEQYIHQIKGIPKRNTSETYRYHLLEKQISEISKTKALSAKNAFKMLEKVRIAKGKFKTLWTIVYNISDLSLSYYTHSNKNVKKLNLEDLNFDHDLSYSDINQQGNLSLPIQWKSLSQDVNFNMMSASFTHLGFDTNFTKELSIHQYSPSAKNESQFSKNYFHFNITIPLLEENKRLIVAIMDSPDNFKKRKAVVGGFFLAKTAITHWNIQIYGLRNGRYSLIALLDDNKNNDLDFNSSNQPIEKYATFGNSLFAKKEDINFESTSEYFSNSNSTLAIEWK
ncbi:MAG: linear amide C-N hydrolase [Saprospiraceae bacterium]|nr:linear amide C-N hydrolase [Saprospiraceae bacterium]